VATSRNSRIRVSRLVARATANATTKALVKSSERNITPRLQKFGRRMPLPV
jgi:hypothetical protein